MEGFIEIKSDLKGYQKFFKGTKGEFCHYWYLKEGHGDLSPKKPTDKE